MSTRALVGRTVSLRVERTSPEGASLSAEGSSTPITLPRAEVTHDLWAGDTISAFVYPDRDGHLLATLRRPLLERGEVAFLRITDLAPFGAFADWGLQKELLVPSGEQIHTVRPGDVVAIGLFLDDRDRLSGTMRVASMLPEGGPVRVGDVVEGVAWRNDPARGLFVIVDRRWVGLVPSEEPHRLRRAESAKFRVAAVLPDGKVTLSLRGRAHEELDQDAERIYADLISADPAYLGDDSPPEQIRGRYGLSKKAYKRAAGRLLKEGRAEIDPTGILIAKRKG